MSQQTELVKAFTATEALARYRRVRLTDSSGVAVEYADAGEPAIGVTQEATAIGLAASVALLGSHRTLVMTAAGAFSAGARLYAAADGKVDDTVTGVYVGRALEAALADGDEVEVLCAASKGHVYANVANSADVENTTAETAFDKTTTVPPEVLAAGDVIRVRASVFVLDNNSTDTLNLKLYVGTEEICATGAVDVADGDVGYIEADIVVRIAGSGGHISACGVTALGVPGTVTAKPFDKADAAEDLSAGAAITVKGTWSVAHADNEAYLTNLIVEHISQPAA